MKTLWWLSNNPLLCVVVFGVWSVKCLAVPMMPMSCVNQSCSKSLNSCRGKTSKLRLSYRGELFLFFLSANINLFRVLEVDWQTVNCLLIHFWTGSSKDTHSVQDWPWAWGFSVYLNAACTCGNCSLETAMWRIENFERKQSPLFSSLCSPLFFSPHVIVTRCALHNFCEKEKDQGNPRWLHEAISSAQRSSLENTHANNQAVREPLKNDMAANLPHC